MADGLRDGTIQVWHTHPGLHLPATRVRDLAQRVLMAEGATPAYVGIVLSRREAIHQMNREFLGHDYPTDVLSFPIAPELNALEGEVYVDLDMARSTAPEYHTSYATEAARYVIHGLLHLLGHDDKRPSERQQMRELENRYLNLYWNVVDG